MCDSRCFAGTSSFCFAYFCRLSPLTSRVCLLRDPGALLKNDKPSESYSRVRGPELSAEDEVSKIPVLVQDPASLGRRLVSRLGQSPTVSQLMLIVVLVKVRLAAAPSIPRHTGCFPVLAQLQALSPLRAHSPGLTAGSHF